MNATGYIETLATPAEITACLSCKRKSCPGYCSLVSTLRPMPRVKSQRRKVRCVETGVLYETPKQAADSVGMSAAAIYCCLRGSTGTCGRLHWKWEVAG